MEYSLECTSGHVTIGMDRHSHSSPIRMPHLAMTPSLTDNLKTSFLKSAYNIFTRDYRKDRHK